MSRCRPQPTGGGLLAHGGRYPPSTPGGAISSHRRARRGRYAPRSVAGSRVRPRRSRIVHPGGLVTLYAHNQRNLVVAGQRVGQGETIALLGGTGRSMGPHVPPIEGPFGSLSVIVT